jgi:hypothetical protein
LHFGEQHAAVLEKALRVLLRFHAVSVAWVKILQAKFLSIRDAVARSNLCRFLDEFASFHGFRSVSQAALRDIRAIL